MPTLDFSFGFDPGSLQKLVELRGFSALLDPEIVEALKWSSDLIVTTAKANAWEVFDTHPTEGIENSIYAYMNNPMEFVVAVGAPYGRRREMGFTGMTDALGRFYASDPGKPYLLPAVEEDQELISLRVEQAVNNALDRIAVVSSI